MEMKPMVYQCRQHKEILYEGKYKGLQFYIASLGSHPVAYVAVPENHPLYKKDIIKGDTDIEILVHGGITFNDNDIYHIRGNIPEGWFIGWDYAHYGDYDPYMAQIRGYDKTDVRRWTTPEIYEEVKNVIEQLIESYDK